MATAYCGCSFLPTRRTVVTSKPLVRAAVSPKAGVISIEFVLEHISTLTHLCKGFRKVFSIWNSIRCAEVQSCHVLTSLYGLMAAVKNVKTETVVKTVHLFSHNVNRKRGVALAVDHSSK